MLFLRALDVPLPDESSAAILQAYSRVLQSESKVRYSLQRLD